MAENLNEIKLNIRKNNDKDEEVEKKNLHQTININTITSLNNETTTNLTSTNKKIETNLLKTMQLEESKEIKDQVDVEEEEEEEEEEDDNEQEDYNRNISHLRKKNFEKTKEDSIKFMTEKQYDKAIKNLNDFLIYIDKTKDKSNSNLVEIYRLRGECYKQLDKYIQASFDFQKAIDITSEECSRSSNLHFSVRKLFSKQLNEL